MEDTEGSYGATSTHTHTHTCMTLITLLTHAHLSMEDTKEAMERNIQSYDQEHHTVLNFYSDFCTSVDGEQTQTQVFQNIERFLLAPLKRVR